VVDRFDLDGGFTPNRDFAVNLAEQAATLVQPGPAEAPISIGNAAAALTDLAYYHPLRCIPVQQGALPNLDHLL
jgi:hypothetical protein